jgi:hypothetical protein
MSREYNLKIHAINISAEPHPPGTYKSLIRRIYDLRRAVQIRGDRHALMTSLIPATTRGANVGMYGVISTFTEINADQPWLNTATGRVAEESETLEISIPDELRPNLSQFHFYFDFENHVFAFQGTTRYTLKNGVYKQAALSPLQMESYFTKLFSDDEIRKNIESLSATVAPDPDTLRQILTAENIREISITVSIPNSDNIADQRGRVADRLRKTRSKKKVEIYTALDKNGVEPDDEMKVAAKVAAFDGRVDARVKVGDHTEKLSTTDRPFTNVVTIDSDAHEESQVVREYAANVARNIKLD